ncbi:hypothetical protein Snas_4316 [Stackebrandtia nassauensis DSM 44728]|uniref:Uncharacterized protein n=1 Tax=Stackebrandtia nassauensis (strain DSM 44728 / CIP 108903 / NRRL B-16338 / NBRC 102104 / LLR-40K-21) TaxID=446470 RepID=D3Q3P6_STANL|nr:hypothetical protein Snas_4316 [Stackebrandtia nassauensis DSM 44728]
MEKATLEQQDHEPYPVDKTGERAWCRTCTRYYQAVIVYPCSHARKRVGADSEASS